MNCSGSWPFVSLWFLFMNIPFHSEYGRPWIKQRLCLFSVTYDGKKPWCLWLERITAMWNPLKRRDFIFLANVFSTSYKKHSCSFTNQTLNYSVFNSIDLITLPVLSHQCQVVDTYCSLFVGWFLGLLSSWSSVMRPILGYSWSL